MQQSHGQQLNVFDPTKCVCLVPPFQDEDLDSLSQTFEHNAESLACPRDKWTLLLRTVLGGKAQVAYSTLSLTKKVYYTTVKEAILRAYKHVPEAYTQKFRGLKLRDLQSLVEYVREKEKLFDG